MRAKQFLPFDAVRGLKEAIKAKEYEAEKVSKGLLLPEEASLLSDRLLEIRKGDSVMAKVYVDGHYVEVSGIADPNLLLGYILIDKKRIEIADLFGISPQI